MTEVAVDARVSRTTYTKAWADREPEGDEMFACREEVHRVAQDMARIVQRIQKVVSSTLRGMREGRA